MQLVQLCCTGCNLYNMHYLNNIQMKFVKFSCSKSQLVHIHGKCFDHIEWLFTFVNLLNFYAVCEAFHCLNPFMFNVLMNVLSQC